MFELRYMGTITGVSDLDPVRWPNSHWRSVKVFFFPLNRFDHISSIFFMKFGICFSCTSTAKILKKTVLKLPRTAL